MGKQKNKSEEINQNTVRSMRAQETRKIEWKEELWYERWVEMGTDGIWGNFHWEFSSFDERHES